MKHGLAAPERLVIADDATGALEAGALLADAGWRTTVSLEPVLAEAEAMVGMWPGRHLSPDAARKSLEVWWNKLAPPAETLVYWKTDSTLRGPIGACFGVLRTLRPDDVLVYCPAYPALGRTVRDGTLFVKGIPLAESEFAQDPLAPARCSRVLEVLGPQFSGPLYSAQDADGVGALLGEACSVIVCDAFTEADVEACHRVCREWGGRVLMAGPAGGIRYWVDRHGNTGWKKDVTGWRVVCGSRHPASRRQAVEARILGLEVVSTPEHKGAEGTAEAEALAELALRHAPEGLIVFGGDTVLAICRVLGVSSLEPWGEVIPGVAVSRAGRHVLVTKAGGFGGLGLVEEIMRKWKEA